MFSPILLIRKIKQRLSFSTRDTDPATAYNLWCENYDEQPDNLVLALDEKVFRQLVSSISFNGKIIADIGCGTGRHWPYIVADNPEKLVGFDVSEGMLKALQQKFLMAETHLLTNNLLQCIENESCDIIISTLTLAHIQDMKEALKEWNRALKKGGMVILTDYHPSALKNGGSRTFRHNNQLIAVKSYLHDIDQVQKAALNLGWKQVMFTEEIIDEKVKHYYEKLDAMHVFEKFINTPVIYGIQFKKGSE